MVSVAVFIDLEGLAAGAARAGAAGAPDWATLPGRLVAEAAATLSLPSEEFSLSHVTVYAKPEPARPAPGPAAAGAAARAAAQSGVELVNVAEQPGMRECRACDLAGTARCNRCRNMAASTNMYGGPVAAAMARDLLRWVRETGADVAVLAAPDRRLLPVIRLLAARGKRVVLAGFSPFPGELSEAAAGVVDLGVGREAGLF